MEDAELDLDLEIIDFKRGLSEVQREKLVPVGTVSSSTIAAAQEKFRNYGSQQVDGVNKQSRTGAVVEECTVYEHKDFDGQFLFISF